MKLDHVTTALKIGSEAMSKAAGITEQVSSLMKSVNEDAQGQDLSLTQTNQKAKEAGQEK